MLVMCGRPGAYVETLTDAELAELAAMGDERQAANESLGEAFLAFWVRHRARLEDQKATTPETDDETA